jgi:hypothetical protein
MPNGHCFRTDLEYAIKKVHEKQEKLEQDTLTFIRANDVNLFRALINTAFACSEAGIVGSNPSQGMDV